MNFFLVSFLFSCEARLISPFRSRIALFWLPAETLSLKRLPDTPQHVNINPSLYKMLILIPLREWIRTSSSSNDRLDDDNNISTDSYLRSALQIARSLVDQFVLEDNNNTNNSYTVGERQRGPQLPPQLLSTPYNDWANHVIDYCRGVDVQCGGELEPLPTEAPSSNPQELQDILNSFLNDDDQFSFNGGVLEQSSVHIVETSSTPHNQVSYHNVARAEILPLANNTTTNNVV
jgi:hypothetical protein